MGKYIWPCPASTRISSPFGYRTNPISGKKELHRGMDIACPAGKPILATRAGKVAEAKFNSSYGNYVLLDHGDNLKSRYAHASKLLAKAGDKVSAGEEIAKVGSTGNSTGAHLHFEIIESGKPMNPKDYVGSKDTEKTFNGDKGSSSGSSAGESEEKKEDEDKDITDIVIKSTSGSGMATRSSLLLEAGSFLQNGCEIVIQNDQYYIPLLEGEISWETERKGAPGKLTFKVVKDGIINFQEGNPVRFRAKNKDVFYGYVFSKQRSDNDFISVTCYDQLRYLKNKGTMKYDHKKYSEVLKMIAADYNLKCGTIEDTGYVIPSRIEETTLFDMLGNASDLTLMSTGKLYVLYDDFGKLCLKNVEAMITEVLIDQDVACGYDYTSSIDSDTYNKVALAYDNKKTGMREMTIAQDGGNQNKWGILQYYEKIDDAVTSPQETAASLLGRYNQKTRSLSISGIQGSLEVRAGSSVVVNLNLGDINIFNKMLVEKAKHTFSHGEHFMDLTLSGIKWGGFSA